MTGWYFKSDETEYGPYSLDELIYLKNKGKIPPGSLVKNEHHSGWVRAESVRELFSKERLTRSRIELASLVKPNAVKEESDISPEIVDFIDETPNNTNLPPLTTAHRNQSHKKVILGVLVGGSLLLFLFLLILFLWKAPAQPETVAGSTSSQSQGARTEGGQSTEGKTGTGDTLSSSAESKKSGASVVAPTPIAESPEEVSQEVSQESKPNEMRNGRTDKEPPASDLLTASRLVTASPRDENVSGNNEEINKRVEREGGKTGEVQISLIWNNRNDLDLHVLCPSGERISFDHRRSADGGELDVDMNVRGESTRPVENIFWPPQGMQKGIYRVFVHHYSQHGSPDPTRFTVRIIEDGKSRQFSGTLSTGEPAMQIDKLSR